MHMESTLTVCKNCGREFSGNYCNNCGEKIYRDHDKKISHVLDEAFHFITHLDGKFLKTFKLYFSKPGLVSKEYCEGRRKKYFKPVSLFLIGVVIYLLFPMLQGLNISFTNHLNNNGFLGIHYTKQLAAQKMKSRNMPEAELRNKFDHTSPKVAKVLMLALLPLTAGVLALIFLGRRRYFFDHFILATELNTIFLFLFFLILPVLFVSIGAVFRITVDYGDGSLVFNIVQGVLFLAILFAAFKRFYGISWSRSLLGIVLFVIGYVLVLLIYRQLVFLVVMLFI
jgi:hypothetical protein